LFCVDISHDVYYRVNNGLRTQVRDILDYSHYNGLSDLKIPMQETGMLWGAVGGGLVGLATGIIGNRSLNNKGGRRE